MSNDDTKLCLEGVLFPSFVLRSSRKPSRIVPRPRRPLKTWTDQVPGQPPLGLSLDLGFVQGQREAREAW